VIVRDFAKLEEYLPPDHHGVINRLLAGRALGDGDQVSIWHGRFEPGGRSERHVHEGSLQIYVGISGEMTVGVGESESVLGPLGTAVIAAGSPHFIENRSDEAAEVLVISVPALR
jgi:quercetin dioxygenase-like cupin family protein